MRPPKHIVLSRTDSIGDVILTLPMAAYLKSFFPEVRISFLGRSYTKAVIEACPYIDAFIEKETFLKQRLTDLPDAIVHVFPDAAIARRARQLGIPARIGTTNRLYHWWTCNKLVRLSRKNSDLHEAQLNIKLLQPFGIPTEVSLSELNDLVCLVPQVALPESLIALLDGSRPKMILHPKSQGSAREWGLESFETLARLLHQNGYQVFISGTEAERAALQPLTDALNGVADSIVGAMNLDTFIAFINACDGLVAASTGPLHIAAALGKKAVGIYPPIRPMHPGRWAPIGVQATALAVDAPCENCRTAPHDCTCMQAIRPEDVFQVLQR
ncbi:MAG: lipopolysaccharide heptosyltransferase family protein [Sphingobacteriales bacterium]|nr:MAG: lipopolysaccharide heptosyltransferase family protein [Sphingobacteriales bacterium]